MHFPGSVIYCALILCLCPPGISSADEETYGGGAPPRAQAAFTAHPPKIDGVLSEPEWTGAPVLYLAANADQPGDAKHNAGEVRFLWNGAGVYVAFRAVEPTPVYGHSKPGGALYQEDVLELFIDQIGDHRQFYEIQIDPGERLYFRNNVLTAAPRVTSEKRLTQEFVESELWRWDMAPPEEFRVASKLDPQTHVWCVEAFLPASFVNRRLGGKALEPCTWRINVARHDWDMPLDAPQRNPKFCYWSPVLPGHPHLSPEAMGYLTLKKP